MVCELVLGAIVMTIWRAERIGLRTFTLRMSLTALSLCVGCERYSAAPLTQSVVEGGLAEPSQRELQVRVDAIRHPLLGPMELRPQDGLSPDEAAVLAVVINPGLRAERDQREIAQAQLLTAGILPNPQLTYSYDWVTGGRTVGTVNPYGLGVNWDVTSLINHDAKVKAASATVAAINLDVAWQEWQVAEAAKSAAYDLLALQSELGAARETDAQLRENLALIRKAAELHAKTSVDLAAAESAAQESNAGILQMTRDLERQRLALNRAIGLAPETSVQLRTGLVLPGHFTPPSEQELVEGIEQRRLDLLGLRRGYESQEQTLRAAVLDQFPKINLGFDKAKDNTNVRTVGVGVSVDIPIFDRNQGVIATEKATRQKLFDEYVSRSFDARADIAAALVDIHSINDQIAAAQAATAALQNAVDVYRQAVDHGNADVLGYYQASNNLAQNKVDVLKLEQQLAENRIALEIASGRYFPDEVHPELGAQSRVEP
jgi:outer membrane protein, heavy metal efflux system